MEPHSLRVAKCVYFVSNKSSVIRIIAILQNICMIDSKIIELSQR